MLASRLLCPVNAILKHNLFSRGFTVSNIFRQKSQFLKRKFPEEAKDGLVLFHCPASKYYILYNIAGVVGGVFCSYSAYSMYSGRFQFRTEDIKLPGRGGGLSAINFDSSRNLISGILVIIALVITGGTLRFTLYSIRSLSLINNSQDLRITTCSFFGSSRTTVVPVSNVYSDSLKKLYTEEGSAGILVKGKRIEYILDQNGVVKHPDLLTTLLTTIKPFVES